MKRKIALSIIIVMFMTNVGCNKFDDSALWDAVNENTARISALEKLCNQMNMDIISLKTIVTALQSNDFVTNVSPLSDGSGYTISFSKSGSIVIKNGVDGHNGDSGKDGDTPVISVSMGSDGVYYWTLNGSWLTDAYGNKIKAQGIDGADGANGTNGITPRLKVESGYWYISYDNEATWTQLGRATGSDGVDGLDGEDGDAFFKGVSIRDGYVEFVLNDGKDTIIQLPFKSVDKITVTVEVAGTLKQFLTIQQQRTVTKLKVLGRINKDDLFYINCYLQSLEELDLSESISESGVLNPCGADFVNRSIRKIILGQVAEAIDPTECYVLDTLIITKDYTLFNYLCSVTVCGSNWPHENSYFTGTPNAGTLIYEEGVAEIMSETLSSSISETEAKALGLFKTVVLPSTLNSVHYKFASFYNIKTVICKALTPPIVYGCDFTCENNKARMKKFYDGYDQLKSRTLYVPKNSLSLYREDSAWGAFGTILPMDD